MAEKTRYSNEELAEFKEIILTKLEKARKDYEIFKKLAVGNENGTSDTSNTPCKTEECKEAFDREEAKKLAQRQIKFIQHLESALVRIENKTYGICRETGKLIAKERLRVVPHATLGIDAKNDQNNKKKQIKNVV